MVSFSSLFGVAPWRRKLPRGRVPNGVIVPPDDERVLTSEEAYERERTRRAYERIARSMDSTLHPSSAGNPPDTDSEYSEFDW